MSQDRHEGIAPDAPPTSTLNEFTASRAAQSQYAPPSPSIPDEYWQQAARAKVATRSSDSSTVACWVLVLLGLIIPIMALGASLWAVWLAREDRRFLAPAAVGFGIVVRPFLG
jgi:hypothetical protein